MRTLLGILFVALLGGISLAGDNVHANAVVKVEQAGKQITAGTQILDVRTQEEWDAGHLKGAKRVELSEKGFVEKVKAGFDPKKPVLVYCRLGGRSEKAAKQLRDAGFKTVSDLDGGITAWQEAGKPVVKDK